MVKVAFWNANVRISEEMYENSSPAMYILRLLGLFPLQVQRDKRELFLKFRPLYALYSCILGASTLTLIYHRIYEELTVDKKLVHTRKNIDKYVRFSGFLVFCFLVVNGVFIMPTRLLQFFKYIKLSGQVDKLIKTEFLKSNKYKSIFMLTAPLVCNICTDAFDVYTDHEVHKLPILGTLRRNLPYYTTYIMAFAVICINGYIANCLQIRVVQMNKILKEEYLNIKKDEVASKNTSAASSASHLSEDNISMIYTNPTVSRTHFKASAAITKVTLAYLKWVKAAQIMNDLYGIVITMTTIGLLCHLVSSYYFIILVLEGRSQVLVELLNWVAILTVHTLRLLLIIEPWHSCMNELEGLKSRICNLLSLNVDQRCRETIGSFAMILCLREYKFSGCGFFIVDRLLYTTLIDTIVTYLVISLQAEEQET